MTILLDKSIDPNIKDILFTNDASTYEQYYWNLNENTSIAIDHINFKIAITASNAVISFNSYDTMIPYINQYKLLHPIIDIITNGLYNDPYYDKVQTGNIIKHEYTNTDIEQDLLKGE